MTGDAEPVLIRSMPDSGATVYFFPTWDGTYRRVFPKLSTPANLGAHRVSEGPTNRRILRSPFGWNVMMVRGDQRVFVCGVQPKRPSAAGDTTIVVGNFADPDYKTPCDPGR